MKSNMYQVLPTTHHFPRTGSSHSLSASEENISKLWEQSCKDPKAEPARSWHGWSRGRGDTGDDSRDKAGVGRGAQKALQITTYYSVPQSGVGWGGEGPGSFEHSCDTT